MVQSFGCPVHLSEDIVQEMYLRMHKYVSKPERIMYNETEVNTFFVYITLRNMYADYTKAKSKISYTDDLPASRYDTDPVERENALAGLVDSIWAEVDTWHWYDKKLFTVYINSGMSMRDLSSETTISLRSIFNTLKNAKERIQTNCKDDYENYKEAGERPW
jgi:DNA-directed RNA polymerase specialized sigma24 family protein